MLSRTCSVLVIVASAWAQQTRPAEAPPKRDDAPTRSSFSAKGLQHEDVLTALFEGNFAGIPYDRGSLAFGVLFEQYLEAYARHCGATLPVNNRVEMTRQECADPPRVPLPGQPPPLPGTESCSFWRTVSLGYADPSLYAAKTQLGEEQLASHVKEVLGANATSARDFIGQARDGLQFISDMDALVRQNACDGGGLRRFQENVVLFAKGKPPMLLPGAPPFTPPSAPASTASPVRPHGPAIPPSQNPVDPALLTPGAKSRPQTAAPSSSVDPSVQQSAADRQRRAQKAVECRQRAVKDHPEGGVAMTQAYTSCLQAK